MCGHLPKSIPSYVEKAMNGTLKPGETTEALFCPGAIMRVISNTPTVLQYEIKGKPVFVVKVLACSPFRFTLEKGEEVREYIYLPGTPEPVLEQVVLNKV